MLNATVFLEIGYIIMQVTFSFDKHDFFYWDCLNSTVQTRFSRVQGVLQADYLVSFCRHILFLSLSKILENEEDMHKMSF